MTAANWIIFAVLSILWGGSFLFIELALEGLAVLSIVWLRVAGATLVLALWLAATGGGFPKGRRAWAALCAMGILNNVLPFCLIVLAQGQITGSLASILNATTPLWTVIVAHVFTADERITRAKAVGLGLGFGGVLVIAGGGGGSASLWAIAASLGAAFSYGFAGVWGRRFKPMGLTPMQVAFGMLASSTVILAPVWGGIDHPLSMVWPGPQPLVAVAALSLLSTALAYILYFRLLASAGATMLSLVTFVIPASALALGIGFLGEEVLPRHLVGLALILAGLLAMDGRVLKWRG